MAKTKSRPKRERAKVVVDLPAEVRAIRAAVEGGRFADAMTSLSTAWAACPAVELAQIAAAVNRKLPRTELPSKIAAREAAWLALAQKHDPVDLPTLLAADWPTHPREAKARLNELVEFPPDPRIADAFLGLRAAKRYKSNAGDAFWRLAFVTIGGWGDPRIAPLADESKRIEDIDWYSIFQPTKKEVKLKGPPALDAAVVGEIDAIAALLAADRPKPRADLGELLAAVYDEPASDGPRLVYADALLAEENPRGELIQLQLAGGAKAAARARALIRAHGATWTDGISVGVDPVFRRGFVAEAVLAKTIDDPPRAWRTVETIRFFGAPKPAVLARFLMHDNLAGVTSVHGIAAASLPAIASRSFDTIGLVELTRIKKTPQMRHLAIPWVPGDATLQDGLHWYDESPCEVEVLEIDGTELALRTGWTWFQKADVSRLAIRSPGFVSMAWELVLDRIASGTSLTATWHGNVFGVRDPLGLAPAIASLPRDALSSFTAIAKAELETAVQERVAGELAKALKKQPAYATRAIFD